MSKAFLRASLVLCLSACSVSAIAGEPLSIDFSDRTNKPLVKKFGYMNSGVVAHSRNQRDLPLLGYVGAESLRIDISNGKSNGWSVDPVGGAQGSGSPVYNWGQLDEVADLVTASGAVPYWSFSYIPRPLQQFNGAWRLPPNDYNKWQEVTREYAAHFKSAGAPRGYYEVFNEPDFDVFWQGSRQEYFELYKYGARGFREGDPDAVVGGPSLAFTGGWINPFIDYVENNDLPLDYFSFHAIGPKGGTDNRDFAMGQASQIRSRLGEDARFRSTELHLNEYNPFFPSGSGDTLLSEDFVATRLLNDYEYFLGQHDITVVSWAQFMDSGGYDPIGLIDPRGAPKRAFFAGAIIGDLPIESYTVSTPNGIHSLASANGAKGGVVLWNESGSTRTIDVQSSNLPFGTSRMTVYRVDETHIPQLGATPGDFLVPLSESIVSSSATGPVWTGAIPDDGIVYLRFENLDADALPPPSEAPGEIARLHHYFPSRGSSRFGYFDRNEWSAHLGLSSQANDHSMVGITATDLDPQLRVRFEVDRSSDEAVGLGAAIRIDFRSAGEITRTVLVNDGNLVGIGALQASIPWVKSTDTIDALVNVEDLSDFVLDLSQLSPSNWDGSALVTFILRDSLSSTIADVYLEALPKLASLPGDYNGDGMVDAADYVVWRDNLGSSGAPGIAGDGDDGSGMGVPDGVVDEADYQLWKSHYGDRLNAGPLHQPVPEPLSALLLMATPWWWLQRDTATRVGDGSATADVDGARVPRQ